MTSTAPPPTMVLTGATSGIGRLAAIELACQGAHIVFVARNESKAAETRRAIGQAAPGARVDVVFGDLAVLADVARVAAEIAATHERIDVLVNNAGIHAFDQRVTVDGLSEMVAVNYVAPWLLTNILRERLVASAPSRVVTVASEASRQSGGLVPDLDLHDTKPFSRLGSSRAYGKTKLMDIMFSKELARRLEGTRVAVNCLCPGFNVTGLGRELGFASPLASVLNWLKIGDPSRGAGIIVRLARAPEFAVRTGGYFSVKDATPLTPVAPGNDPVFQQELWARTAAFVAARVGLDFS
ncbi:MAG: SDR family NAD(P)-dependent oxidoreductase [Pseudomonadota bacterium]|nr:SDR family NAD(P)-dependent oxidoreductase [Pseudomonadota bacterium]